MKVGILGFGIVAKALAAGLLKHDREVMRMSTEIAWIIQ
jgi:pyrroline-5-carboxylate reductase